jgi:hypothetical protein
MKPLPLLVIAAFAAAALAQSANAVPPTRADFNTTSNTTLAAGALCSFQIALVATQTFTTTTFFDDSGVISKRITEGTEQDTFSANGNSLQGDPYSFTFVSDFVDGVRVSREGMGVAELVHLPDGGVFVVAGRVDALSGAPIFTVDSGNSGTNLDAFCAALS